MRSTAYGTGLNTTTSQPNMNWAGPITKCDRSGLLSAIGTWSCWLSPSACSWVHPLLRQPEPLPPPRSLRLQRAGKKGGLAGGERLIWAATLRQVRQWLCPWARMHQYWQRWSSAAPPPELAALLDHVARSLPLAAPT